jgi:multidrug resistance efflux pump
MSESRFPAVADPPVNGELRNRVQQIRLDNQLGGAKASRGGSGWLPWLLCGMLAATWAGVAIRSYKNAPPPAGEPVAASADRPSGSASASAPAAATPRASEGAVQVEVMGYLAPARKLAVSPIDVGGRLIALDVTEGKFYPEGAVLAKIDPSSYQALVDEAEATLASARQRQLAAEARLAGLLPTSVREVEVAQVQAQLNEAKAQRDRNVDQERRLLTIAGASAQEIVQAKNEVLMSEARIAKLEADLVILKEGPRKEQIRAAEAEVAGAKAEVAAAAARLVQSKWRLDNCVIKAPIAGTVLTKKAEKGDLVNPQAFAGGSGSVCEMADLADLEVDLKVAEREISKLVVGQPCRIRANAYPDRTYTGRLDRIMPTANRADNTVNVRVKVKLADGEAPGTFLKPEMGAIVSFLPPSDGGK